MYQEVTASDQGFTLTHVIAPAGEEVFPGSPNPKLNDLHVRLTHVGLPGLAWYVMIPENFYGKGREDRNGFRPTLGMKWQSDADRLFFPPLDYRENIRLEVSAEIRIEAEDAVRYTVTAANRTDQPIEHVNCNCCFNHHWAPGLGRDGYVLIAGQWVRTLDLDIPPPGIPYFVVAAAEETWRAAQQQKEHYPLHPTARLQAGLIATTAQPAGQAFTLANASPQAALVWHNVRNPCTDLWLWFGRLLPEEQRSVTGRIYFLTGRDGLQQVRDRYYSDQWPS